MPKVIVYTQTVCKYCQIVKNYLEDKGIEYEARNINDSEEYVTEHASYGFQSVPLTVVGEEVVVGFDVAKLNRLFG